MTSDIDRSPPCGISVLIVGAGVGGLMTALECWRRGCDVRILERAKTCSAVGDSFQIGPTAINSFKNYPFLEQKSKEIQFRTMIAVHNQRGERIQEPAHFENFMSKSSSATTLANMQRHSRPLFHAMLTEQLAQVGLKVEYDMQVREYFEDISKAKAGVVVKDGFRLEADLVIAADGVRGNSWPLVAGEPVPARSSGDAIFRVAYPVELALADPMIAERFPLRDDGYSVMEMWVSPGGLQVFFWRNELEMNWAMTHPDTGNAKESWGNKADPEDAIKFTSTIEGWPEVANRVIKATPPDQLVDWKLMWRDPQPTSTSPGGLVVQVGDAAHTFLPSSGNGGTQAIEDALSLAACISKAGGKQNLPEATKIHSLLRFERVSCLQAFGVMNKDKRDVSKHKDVGKDKKAFVHFGRWITEHDPEEYALENYDAARECLRKGEKWVNSNTPPGMVYRPWTIDGLMDAYERGEETVLSGDWD